MRPTSIPDNEIMEGHMRLTMGAPRGMESTVRPVEMLAYADGLETIYRSRIELEDGDLERLAAGEPFWISFWGHVVPFSVAMAEPELPDEGAPPG